MKENDVSIKKNFSVIHSWWKQNLAPKSTIHDFGKHIKAWGLSIEDDIRFDKFRKLSSYSVAESNESVVVELKLEFIDLIKFLQEAGVTSLITRCISGSLTIADFKDFKKSVKQIYLDIKHRPLASFGSNAEYIPQLKKANPNLFGVSICTIDGQRFNIGDGGDFVVQSCIKPFVYALALETRGIETVHKYIGKEQSGLPFNSLQLNTASKPHNAMINSGSIIAGALICPKLKISDKFDRLLKVLKRATGGKAWGFDNSVYQSEKETAEANYALAYMLRNEGCFPEGDRQNNIENLEFYLQCCSIEANTRKLAAAGATIANGGICPFSGERVFKSETCRSVLAQMYSSGVYESSGEWGMDIGTPAKSGVSGAIFSIIPGFGCISTYSSPIDQFGNSVRGVEFFKRFVAEYDVHLMESNHESVKRNLFKKTSLGQREQTVCAFFAAGDGDLFELKRILAAGISPNVRSYDGRTLLHVAAVEGRSTIARFLVSKGADPDLQDQFGNRAIDDANRQGHLSLVAFLESRTTNQDKPFELNGRSSNREGHQRKYNNVVLERISVPRGDLVELEAQASQSPRKLVSKLPKIIPENKRRLKKKPATEYEATQNEESPRQEEIPKQANVSDKKHARRADKNSASAANESSKMQIEIPSSISDETPPKPMEPPEEIAEETAVSSMKATVNKSDETSAKPDQTQLAAVSEETTAIPFEVPAEVVAELAAKPSQEIPATTFAESTSNPISETTSATIPVEKTEVEIKSAVSDEYSAKLSERQRAIDDSAESRRSLGSNLSVAKSRRKLNIHPGVMRDETRSSLEQMSQSRKSLAARFLKENEGETDKKEMAKSVSSELGSSSRSRLTSLPESVPTKQPGLKVKRRFQKTTEPVELVIKEAEPREEPEATPEQQVQETIEEQVEELTLNPEMSEALEILESKLGSPEASQQDLEEINVDDRNASTKDLGEQQHVASKDIVESPFDIDEANLGSFGQNGSKDNLDESSKIEKEESKIETDDNAHESAKNESALADAEVVVSRQRSANSNGLSRQSSKKGVASRKSSLPISISRKPSVKETSQSPVGEDGSRIPSKASSRQSSVLGSMTKMSNGSMLLGSMTNGISDGEEEVKLPLLPNKSLEDVVERLREPSIPSLPEI